MIYDSIERLKEICKALKILNFDAEIIDTINEVISYTEDCYIDECEKLGSNIVANADIIEEKSYERGYNNAVVDATNWWRRTLMPIVIPGVDRNELIETFIRDASKFEKKDIYLS